ncbi:hypothetical protein FHW88_002795 [Mucilaginibacter sp. SG538B]|uniref:hypothetical protein n=1 Tax=Mucilaginibacter sp. SG538B TaxID=2587021 RepID=UPI00159EB583|nr:hypothetical protein [Mucilaginibacter sp. SG538B]NVM64506.1 hypothetical protein [Mucilaginibacter sp. SG538B]
MEPLIFEADETIYCDDPQKWFPDYIPLIPSDTIINKVITGFGATTTEITAHRNSIIILPNVATIHNKHGYHAETCNTFPVYEGVSADRIAAYLKSQTRYKKILTTPESFSKILEAFKRIGISPFNDYFVLTDEQHKQIQDIAFRPNITMALDSFFKFKDKAMISSTPIKPSDPRFKNFKSIKLQPTYAYTKDVEVLFHDNLIFALKDCFERYPLINQFVFFNSINGIQDLIQKLEIGNDSVIFCSKESAVYLKTQEYAAGEPYRAFSKFTPETCSKYNFFTSSFYNGLDIILNEAPQVIMISLPGDAKTHLDPYTDIIQIIGRFRKISEKQNPIYAEALHLVEYNRKPLNYMPQRQLTEWLGAGRNVYDTVLKLMYSNPNPLERNIYVDILERLPFHKVVANKWHLKRNNSMREADSDSYSTMYNIDYFMIDKIYEEERIKGYYSSPINLMAAYERVGISTSQDNPSFETFLNERIAPYNTEQKLNLRKGKRYSKENIKKIVLQLTDLDPIGGNNFEYDIATYKLTDPTPLIRYAFDKLGREKLAELDYSISKIKQALIDYDVKDGKNSHPVIDSVYNNFSTGYRISLKKIKETLQTIYDRHNIPAKAKASDIGQWFEVKQSKLVTHKRNTGDKTSPKKRNEERAYILLKRLFDIHRGLK